MTSARNHATFNTLLRASWVAAEAQPQKGLVDLASPVIRAITETLSAPTAAWETFSKLSSVILLLRAARTARAARADDAELA